MTGLWKKKAERVTDYLESIIERKKDVKDIYDILEKNNLTAEQIDHFVPHQANFRIIEAVRTKLNFPVVTKLSIAPFIVPMTELNISSTTFALLPASSLN